MYVVKVVANDGGADYKTFSALPDALRRFNKPDRGFFDGPTSAHLFDVPGVSNPNFAIALVEGGQAVFLKRTRFNVF